jgi:hypothetical protein
LVEPEADVLGGEPVELLGAECGDQVEPYAGAVAGQGGGADSMDGDVVQPMREVVGYGRVLGGPGSVLPVFVDLLKLVRQMGAAN